MTRNDAPKSDQTTIEVCSKGHSWSQSIYSKRNGRGCPFCARKRAWKGETDLFTEVPWAREFWDYEKNRGLDPESLLKASEKLAWWVCEKGHRFEKTVGQMVLSGCSYCSNRTLLAGFNDLETVRPDLAAEFDVDLNGGLLPSNIIFGTSKKVWWRCHNNHTYQAKVSQRNFSNSGCGICLGNKVLTGFNDLATKYPEVAKSWDFDLNGDVSPTTVASTSPTKFRWKCETGHSWEARVGDRVSKKQGCAVCANRQVLSGFNDLLTVSPELASTLAPGKNPENFASTVVPHSQQLAWWICSLGHTYQASVKNRQNSACAICAGQKVLVGFNDLQSQNPDAAAHFLQGKNGMEPSAVLVSSRVLFWWECDHGHQFRAHPDSVLNGNWCPYCGNKKVLKGFNDLETVAPGLAGEWHPTLNGATLPSEVLHGSHRKYWWLCSAGHSFAQSGQKRRAGQGCPGCAKTGFNPTLPGLLYVLVDQSREAIKVGITNAGSSNRLKLFRESGWRMVTGFRFDQGFQAELAEAAFFKRIRIELQIPVYLGAAEMKRTGGWTETMSLGLASQALVLKLLNEVFDGLGLLPQELESVDN